jgi:hypothetical protein
MPDTVLGRSYYPDVLAIDDWFGDYASDYNVEGIRREVLALANERLPEGVTLYISGNVFVDLDKSTHDEAEAVNWADLVTSEDLEEISERYHW